MSEPRRELRRLGPYELLHEVGYGGMGSVFLAKRAGPGGFQKRVAIKTIHPHLAKELAFVRMFLDEARIAAAMNHPNVAQVFELGEVDGRYFLAMEYLDGEHLGTVRERMGHLEPRVVARIGSLAARGLHHAHEARDEEGRPLDLVHRDVSPQNIFLTYDGQVKVTDFGIARAEGRLAQTTDTGRLKGKCAYMAPEQITSKPVDRRADLFALGVVMRELLTGERLFSATTDAEILIKIVNGEIPPLDEAVACPDELERIVARTLAHDPGDRYATAAALADALDAYLASNDVPAVALSELMDAHFGPERAAKERAARSDPSRRLEVRRVVSDSSVSGDADTVLASRTPTSPTRSSTLRWLGLGGVVALVLIATLAWDAADENAADENETAIVRIDSQPSGATAWMDGEAVGATPVLTRNVPLGRHTLRLSLRDYEPLEVSFDADRTNVELSYQLREHVAAVERVDGVESGGVEPHPQQVTEPETGGEIDRALIVGAKSGRRGHRTMASGAEPLDSAAPGPPAEPAPAPFGSARLSLVTQPWATISINGRDFGRTPLYQRSVPAGPLRIELRARGTGPVVTKHLRAEADAIINDRLVLPES